MESNACVVIPARYNSSRYPGKPLVTLLDKPMVIWVCELSSKAVDKSNVYVATDSKHIKNVVEDHGFKAIMTSGNALTGTDRIAEATKSELLTYDIIINVQGDEPMVEPLDILQVIDLKKANPKNVINCFCNLSNEEDVHSKNIPKVITNESNKLLYISRQAIPGFKTTNLTPTNWKKQVCIYGYSREELKQFTNYGRKSYLEKIEDIEILRFFELGIEILMHECPSGSLAVDCPEDVRFVEKELSQKL